MAVTTEEARDALVERIFEATVSAMELFGVYLGDRLGLYAALAADGASTPDQLAATVGIHPRYAREWLEQQAVAGFLDVDGDGDPASRRYTFAEPYAEVLVDPESPTYVAPFASMIAGIGGVLPELLDAYRTGGGVPFARYGADLRDGQAAINRPAFLHEMREWIAAMPDVHARLDAEPSALIADIGCGAGWSSIGLARAYPKAHVHGFDLDEASIADARRNATTAGVDGRLTFAVHDAARPADGGRYELVCVFEALHDMARPVEALGAMKAMLAEGGSVLVVDEKVADAFEAPGDLLERMMYGWSILHCLPVGLAEQPSAATGTVMREETLRRYAEEAGLPVVEVLPIENDLFRFYRLKSS